MNLIEQIEQEQIAKLTESGSVPEFAPGDTVRVHFKVVEGTRERIQVYEGVVIARTAKGVNSAFTVRKISYGEGVERVFPLYSPRIDKIEVIRRGKVRRAKLYYLRGLRGKKARIAEKVERRIGTAGGAKKQEAAVASEAPTLVLEEGVEPQVEATPETEVEKTEE